MAKPKPKRHHHFTPRLLLRAFATPETDYGVLYAYKKVTGECHKGSPINLGFENDLYTTETADGKDHETLENAFGDIEALAGSHHAALNAGKQLSGRDRDEFAYFLALQYMRVPGYLRMVSDAAAAQYKRWIMWQVQHPQARRHLAEEGAKKLGYPVGVMEAFLKRHYGEGNFTVTFPKKWGLGMLSKAHEIVPLIASMKWAVYTAPPGRVFVCGDNPFFFCDPHRPPDYPLGTGLATRTVEVTFPLSKEKALLLTWEGEEGVVPATDRNVDQFNKRAVQAAERFVYSPEKSETLAHWLRECGENRPTVQVS